MYPELGAPGALPIRQAAPGVNNGGGQDLLSQLRALSTSKVAEDVAKVKQILYTLSIPYEKESVMKAYFIRNMWKFGKSEMIAAFANGTLNLKEQEYYTIVSNTALVEFMKDDFEPARGICNVTKASFPDDAMLYGVKLTQGTAAGAVTNPFGLTFSYVDLKTRNAEFELTVDSKVIYVNTSASVFDNSHIVAGERKGQLLLASPQFITATTKKVKPRLIYPDGLTPTANSYLRMGFLTIAAFY